MKLKSGHELDLGKAALTVAGHDAGGSIVLDVSLGRSAVAGLHDHRVSGRAVFPAAAYVELAAAAGDILSGTSSAP